MRLGFSYIGLIWLIMLFVPNIIWTKNKPEHYEEYAERENRILLALERAGQAVVTVTALVFSDFNYKGWNFWLFVLVLSFLCMVLYEVFWIRYFRSGRTMRDFYSGLLFMPVAGATLPVIAFFLLGIYGGNGLMIIGTLILGIGHIGIDDARWYKCLFTDERYIQISGLLEKRASEYDAYEKDLEYQVPVFFVSGTDDWICPAGIVEEYVNDITAPKKDIYLFEGCGHGPPEQLPEEFAEAVKSFLQK